MWELYWAKQELKLKFIDNYKIGVGTKQKWWRRKGEVEIALVGFRDDFSCVLKYVFSVMIRGVYQP